ncbi:hypothetical protein [Novosphingobium sp. 9U]|uniref:hypothetical protein n=1 Tax=Novosphingobium sp. 9U TaxID=2653158 RepID=UPI0012F3AB7F|nr:hypothetical protein [Novosphingobium sp. 9U]VWX47313.1 conserved hypothetical protein [Novosphingobium sp. 9U]
MTAMNERDLVLHATAIKRHAPLPAIAKLAGVPEAHAQAVIESAVATGRMVEARGAYALTPLAGVALVARYPRHFGTLREDAVFVGAYEGFERINRTLKQIITDWQTLDVGGAKVANDHSDKAHDEAVIDRLGGLHEQAEPILQRLASRLPRLKYYADKLLAALEASEDGDHEWVSDIRRDSYHTVWFELHEELLRIMGREREE